MDSKKYVSIKNSLTFVLFCVIIYVYFIIHVCFLTLYVFVYRIVL